MNISDARFFATSLRDDLPTIDLHGSHDLTSAQERLESELFLFSSRGDDVCRVVHGIGAGKMKNIAHEILKKNPLVHDFRLSEDGGSTVVLF